MTAKARSWRWLRLVVPTGIVLVIVLVGALLYWLEQPDQDDSAYLSPTSGADIGARTLADKVRAGGVSIERVTKTSDALVAANAGGATLLITTPQLVHPLYLRMLKLLPSSTTVVLVEPDLDTLDRGLLPIWAAERALASAPSDPGCDYRPAAAAGRAGVRRTRYGPVDRFDSRELARCYDDALVVFQRGTTTVTAVGSADPFRNDRIGELGNATLAVGLLSTAPKLIWLDLHRREQPPGITEDPASANGPAAPPSLRPVAPSESIDPDFPVGGGGGSGRDRPGRGGGGGSGEGDASGGNPLWQAFPPWTYVAAALIGLVFALFALAKARRLGTPVVEPLPVVVRATETVAGRGRLYQRAKARGETLETLRTAALAKLTRLLRLEPDVDRDHLVQTVAAQSGWPPATVAETLFGTPPDDDVALVQAAVRLEALLTATSAAAAPDVTSEGESR